MVKNKQRERGKIFAEIKAEGFDLKVICQLLKLRRIKKEDIAEQEELLILYGQALGE
jgi:uncharacterized protein (UPF0335 family)